MDPTGRVVASSLPPLAPLVHTREGREALGRTGGAINQALGDLGGATNQALGDVGHTLNPATYL